MCQNCGSKKHSTDECRGTDTAASYGYNPADKIDDNKNVDAALDSILRASGSALKNYTLPINLDRMREAMRKIMSASYIAGSNDTHKAIWG